MTVSQPQWSPLASGFSQPQPVTNPSASPVPALVSVLIVDPDQRAAMRLTSELRPFHQIASAVDSTEAALSWLRTRSADVIALFAASRDQAVDGANRIRSASELPLIVVGPDATSESRVGAFDSGAEDYIVHPVHPAELDRRVRVLIRHHQQLREADKLYGPAGLVMNVRAHEVHIGDERLALTPKEFAVLEKLLERRGEVVLPDELSLAIWGYETFGSRNFVEAHISRLRGKLRRLGATRVITTVRGVGYVVR